MLKLEKEERQRGEQGMLHSSLWYRLAIVSSVCHLFLYSFCFITWFHFFRVIYRVSWWLINHFSFNNQGLLPKHFNLAQCQPVKKIISAQYKFHNSGQVNLCTPNRSKKGKVLLEVARLEIHLQVNCLFIEHRIKADNDLFPLWDIEPL